MNNEAAKRHAIWARLREDGYTRCTMHTPLYLKLFRQDGTLRLYSAFMGKQRHYFLEVRRYYRGIPKHLAEARRVVQTRFNRTVWLLEIRKSAKTGKLLVRVHE